MKHSAIRLQIIAALFIAVAICGIRQTSSNTDKRQVAAQPERTARKLARQSEPLSYRSPGATHKLMLRGEDAATVNALLATGQARRAKTYKAFTLLEVSDDALATLDDATRQRAELRDDLNLILLRRGQLDTTAPEPAISDDLRAPANAPRGLRLVQLFGLPTPQAIAGLQATGAKIISYIPNNAYLIWGTQQTFDRLKNLAADTLQWDAPLHPAYKVDTRINFDSVEQLPVTIELVDTPDTPRTLAQIEAIAHKVLMPDFAVGKTRQIKILTESYQLKAIAQLPDVVSIERWSQPRMMDERANQIVSGATLDETINNVKVTRPANPGYLAFLNSLGFNSNFDFVVDVSDSGFDRGSATLPALHPDFLDASSNSRMAYVRDFSFSPGNLPAHDASGHGTINASIIGGLNTNTGNAFRDSQGYQYGLGIAPFVRLGISKIFDDQGNFASNLSYGDLLRFAYGDGARISSNSWGLCNTDLGFCNLYNADARAYDALARDIDPNTPGFQQMTLVFSSGNDGNRAPQAVSMPATAKNVITVGASEGFRATDANGAELRDGCNVTGSGADNAQDVVGFSSGGPLQDGRAKPDLVAPGTHITGAASQDDTFKATAEADLGVCDRYFPAGQTLYTWSSGTSHSTPVVSGGAALAFQWLRSRLGAEPSAAMVKALLLNSTTYLTGRNGSDNLPGAKQGWGLLNIARMFETTERLLYDESPDRVFTQSGGAPFEITGVVSDPTKEFRVMLVWSDAPGATLSNAPYVNQLNLEVTIGGATYKGNVFVGQYSKAGGQADFLNNVQGVRLPAGTTGPFVIRVRPVIIAGDGLPFNGVELDQDFALVATNATARALPILAADVVRVGNTDIDDVSVRHANGTTDRLLIPGETAQLTIGVRNSSATAATISGDATLSFAGGASATTAYPAIPARGVGRNATAFTISVPSALQCGTTAELKLQLPTANAVFVLPVRVQVGRVVSQQVALDDDVDSGNVKWKGKKGFSPSSDFALSGTQSYHAVDPGKPEGDSQLSTLTMKKGKTIPENAGNVRLTFSHIFNFEPGFDGGVAEISTDNGETWIDLGSRVLVGGYDGKVTSNSDNPLGDRFVWSTHGRAGVFSQVVISLDDFIGKRVRLRFLAGFDGATGILDGYKGWYIDNIKITADIFECR